MGRMGGDDLRWTANGNGEFSTWNTHLGVCYDFANIYAIMCRELGVPCRIVSTKTLLRNLGGAYNH